MDLGKKILGQNIFDQLMKMTFYGQFVAGEDHISIKPLIQKNRAFGVGTVLDYSVEDRSHGDKPERESDATRSSNVATKRSKLTAFSRPSYSSSSISAAGDGGIGEHHRDKNYEAGKQLSDSQKEMIGPCTYFHADEAKCDHHMETFMKCIKASGGSSVDGFSAIKMTALGRPQLLLRFSDVLVKWQRFFTFLVSQQDGMEALQEKLELTRLQLGKLEPLLQNITVEDENQLRRTLQRLDVLGKCAIEHGVRLMVDAEQTYFQPAISKLTLDLQRMYNTEEPVVFKPYQCYLKEAYKNVTMDIELSKREGWRFAAKLVRGAYMHQERQRAKEFQYEDPINPDYGSTSRMYHRCLNHVLDEIGLNRKANVMVASHNEDTIIHTRIRINELGLLPRENKVFFGQLLGMCDQISFPLGQAGFPIYKYVPYGPVNEVMPYLSRRAQENRGFMKGAQKEKELLWNELKRRLVSGELLYRPVY